MYYNITEFLSKNRFQIIFIMLLLIVISALFSYWNVVVDSKAASIKKTVIVEGYEIEK